MRKIEGLVLEGLGYKEMPEYVTVSPEGELVEFGLKMSEKEIKMLTVIDKLNGLRQQYASANQQGKEKLAPAILDLEKRILQMNEELDALGVSVRNAEKTKSK